MNDQKKNVSSTSELYEEYRIVNSNGTLWMVAGIASLLLFAAAVFVYCKTSVLKTHG